MWVDTLSFRFRSTVGLEEDGDALVALCNARYDLRVFVARHVCNWEV